MSSDLITLQPSGLYCAAGDFFIDPWSPVDRAIVTHAHSDHARPGSRRYLTAEPGEAILRVRLGSEARIETIPYDRRTTINGVAVSLHPAGHLLGSAQVRVEHDGQVTVVSGDYKLQDDATCDAFEPVVCDTFISECTFGLPIYRWPDPTEVCREINSWWAECRADGETAVLYTYALGKAQRLLSGLDPDIGPILMHGAVDRLTTCYRELGVSLPDARYADPDTIRETRGGAIVLAPPSTARTPWLRRFGRVATAFASGWMQIRGTRRRRSVDRGFIVSDHADWPDLHRAIEATGARHIGLTHGYTHPMARWLKEQGYETTVFPTRFEGERETGGEGGDRRDEQDST